MQTLTDPPLNVARAPWPSSDRLGGPVSDVPTADGGEGASTLATAYHAGAVLRDAPDAQLAH